MADVFDNWMDDRHNHTYFKAMTMIADNMYIGEEVATDTLRQRFHSLAQKKYNKVTRKSDFLSVSEYHSEIVALLNETNDMDANAIAQQVPELDTLFYHGLIDSIEAKTGIGEANPASCVH